MELPPTRSIKKEPTPPSSFASWNTSLGQANRWSADAPVSRPRSGFHPADTMLLEKCSSPLPVPNASGPSPGLSSRAPLPLSKPGAPGAISRFIVRSSTPPQRPEIRARALTLSQQLPSAIGPSTGIAAFCRLLGSPAFLIAKKHSPRPLWLGDEQNVFAIQVRFCATPSFVIAVSGTPVPVFLPAASKAVTPVFPFG